MLRKAEASRSWKWSPNSQQGNRTPVRQPQGSEFCQQLEWAWKQILLQSIQVRTQQSGLHLAFSLSREPSWVRSDFWLTEMWDNKWVLFLATTLVAIWYTVIENWYHTSFCNLLLLRNLSYEYNQINSFFFTCSMLHSICDKKRCFSKMITKNSCHHCTNLPLSCYFPSL